MPDSKITALTSISTSTDPANDPLVIVDVSDTSMAATGTTKKVTLNQLLGASGTATLASATITGDLTVDTSTLKVDSANNRVGIGTASPAVLFHVALPVATFGEVGRFYDSSGNGISFTANASSGFNQITSTGAQPLIVNVNSSERYRIASDGVATWSNVGGVAGTAMTLNSTGLGVGVSPAASSKIHTLGNGNNVYAVFQNGDTLATNKTSQLWLSNGPTFLGANNREYRIVNLGTSATASDLVFDYWTGSAIAERMRIDSSGNVGIGVTPSAWVSYQKAIDFGGAGNYGSVSARTDFSSFATNCYFNGTSWIYKNTYPAYSYEHTGGVHKWNTAPSGTAGTAITFTQAMTLDASGNLNLGVTSSLINTTRRLSVSGTVAAALQSTGAATVETINVWHTATSGNNIFVDFDTEAAVTSRGSISYNRAGGLVAYNTTSDYRAKDIIGPVSNSGSLIDSLKVYVGKMKGATIERPMLIAHEAQEVAPYAVTGTKDEVDADGKPKYQQMDASALVPLLIAEIQSLRARVQTLETR